MESVRELTCIGCPMGCLVSVTMDGKEIKSVSGNSCANGDRYARREVTNPTRIVTSTAIVRDGDLPRVSVKTKTDVPKDKIFDVMKEINKIQAKAPVRIGDVLIPDVAGTGVPVIATRNIQKA
ncbi:MAG: DUF1667 domain-containing protein [Bilifractor sp.]|jgi:CxxC motif-containing protein|nr:DUF1667 domain-containing protein [Lachnospiraceae bacterium]